MPSVDFIGEFLPCELDFRSVDYDNVVTGGLVGTVGWLVLTAEEGGYDG